MNYQPKTKEWFIERIGKTVFRDAKGKCCNRCDQINEQGLVISNEQHASYLALIDSDYAAEGIYLNYRDEK